MLTNDTIVFVHFPRTGGTAFVHNCYNNLDFSPLHHNSNNRWMPGPGHNGVIDLVDSSFVPESDKLKEVITLIRNPWSWYYSLYEFQINSPRSSHEELNPVYEIAKNNTFDYWLRHILDENNQLSYKTTGYFKDRWPTRTDWSDMYRLGIGSYTWYYISHFTTTYTTDVTDVNSVINADPGVSLTFFDMQTELDQFIEFVKTTTSTTEFETQLRQNWVTPTEDYKTKYDSSLIDLVTQKDNDVITKHSFTF
ncbi:MAG: hypothetical protein VW683_00335 [Betaproteobacteria bacterium]|jgi:hypothetical protein